MQSIINTRTVNLDNISAIRQALVSYSLYGENSPLRNIFSQEELQRIRPEGLTQTIKSLRSYRHRLFYYGKNVDHLMQTLERVYKIPSVLKAPPVSKIYLVEPTKHVVYFVNYEGAQAQVGIISRGERFSRVDMALSNMFNRFIEKVSFQQIREARSLAYSNWTLHRMSDDTLNYNYTEMYVATQANKVNDLLVVATGLMQNIADQGTVYDASKVDQLKRYERERINGTNIFWSHESLMKLGIVNDYREVMYNAIKHMSFKDIRDFYERNISSKDFGIVIVGDKKQFDLDALSKYGEVKEMDKKYLFNY
ncbi:MAG: insulinase family protein [Chitinophagaceae bacterium]|nr:insulinase family protein [Chitinophagaceae bacterium]